MAVTKIWSIKGRIDKVISYVSNPVKTEYTEDDLQELRDVINYAMQDYKTEKQRYVSGINCDPYMARKQMLSTKLILTANIIFQYGKKSISVRVEKYFTNEMLPYVDHQDASNSVNSLKVNNVTVFYFQQGDDYTLTYKDGLLIYTISVPFDCEDTIKFAKSIK